MLQNLIKELHNVLIKNFTACEETGATAHVSGSRDVVKV